MKIEDTLSIATLAAEVPGATAVLENSVLFPRALSLEGEALGSAS